jgi:predicted nuclease with TOPRIM domain
MTDKVMMELAKMQTEIRNLRQDNKRYSQMLIDRDDKLRVIDDKYKEKIQKLKDDIAFKDRMLETLRPKPKIKKGKNVK